MTIPSSAETTVWHLGIIGHPLGHTLSPRLHAIFLQDAGLSGHYEAWDTPPESLADRLESLKQSGVNGFNVTIPHKTAIMDFLDEVDPLAATIGAVNTVMRSSSGKLHGHNTDCDGFWDSLPSTLQDRVPGSTIILLGAGGSARAVGAALIRSGVSRLILVVRDESKASQTVAILSRCGQLLCDVPPEITTLSSEMLNATGVGLSDVLAVINTTPVGMSPHPEVMPMTLEVLAGLPDTAWAVDLIYKPRPTQWLRAAQDRGVSTVDGLGMLVHQGARAFTCWTGVSLSEATIHRAMKELGSGSV